MTKTGLEFQILVIVICLIFVICDLEFLFLQYFITPVYLRFLFSYQCVWLETFWLWHIETVKWKAVTSQSEVTAVNATETRPGPSLKLSLTILFVFIAAVLVILLLRNDRDSTVKTTKQIQVGFPAPNFTFPDLNGQQVSLSDHRGKVVLVNIWATWCPPCRLWKQWIWPSLPCWIPERISGLSMA
jgi:thiol:disulfide interchange protein